MRSFCKKKTHVHKIHRFRGGGILGFFWGGGSADFIFMGARIFLTICLVFIGYRASIAEIPLLWGGVSHLHFACSPRGNAQKRSGGRHRTQLAMLRHQRPHSAQYPVLPFLLFLEFLVFFPCEEFLVFWVFFPSFPGILGFGGNKTSSFFWLFSLPFCKKTRKGRTG